MSIPNDNQIRFRAQEDLFVEIQARSYGDTPSAVAYRDLRRYYQLLARQTPKFSEAEANLLLRALFDRQHDASAADLVWGAVDEAMRNDGFSELGIDRQEFVARLRDELSPFEQFAIVDAVERVKRLRPQPKTRRERDLALQKVGLLLNGRALVEASWDNLYEAASDAITETRCEVYHDPPANRLPKSVNERLRGAVPLMVERGHIIRETADLFSQLLELYEETRSENRQVPTDEAALFSSAARELEQTFWILVRDEKLPAEIYPRILDPQTQRWYHKRLAYKPLTVR